MKEKKIVARVVCGRTVHVARGSFALFVIDYGIHVAEIVLACGVIWLCGYIAG